MGTTFKFCKASFHVILCFSRGWELIGVLNGNWVIKSCKLFLDFAFSLLWNWLDDYQYEKKIQLYKYFPIPFREIDFSSRNWFECYCFSAGLCSRKPWWRLWVWSATLPRIQLWSSISSWRGLCKRANVGSFATASYCPRYGELWRRFLFQAPTCCAKSRLHREKFGLKVCCCPGTDSQIPVQIRDSCPLQTTQEVNMWRLSII